MDGGKDGWEQSGNLALFPLGVLSDRVPSPSNLRGRFVVTGFSTLKLLRLGVCLQVACGGFAAW